jgi:hypothetical protein
LLRVGVSSENRPQRARHDNQRSSHQAHYRRARGRQRECQQPFTRRENKSAETAMISSFFVKEADGSRTS